MMTTTPALGGITCDLQHERTVNYALQQNHVPIIKRLRLTNAGETTLPQVTVTVTASPDFALPWTTTIATLPAGETVDLGVVDLHLSAPFLAGLTERLAGTLTVTVVDGETLLATTHSPIDVLAYDEWNGVQTLPEIIAAFITPNHPEVSRLLSQVATVLGNATGNPALDGYQSKDPRRIRQQMAAIYVVLQSQQIAYCVPPTSFEEQGQKIRTPDVIREYKLGTCLDLAVLFAACAEAAGLHPLLIFIQGHAFVGAWLVEETFAESIQDDVTLLSKRIAPGVQEICLVEATAFTAGNTVSFEEAVAAGEAHLRQPERFHFFVDIHRARMSRLRPLPLRVQGQVVAEDSDTARPAVVPVLTDVDAPLILDGAPDGRSARTRLEEWERRLLDLTLRNPLLSFRVTSASIPLLIPELATLEDKLYDGADFQVHQRPQDWEATPRDATVFQRRAHTDPQVALLQDEFASHRLRADLPEKELGMRLTQLYRAARTSIEENGANTLFLAMGMLVWYESEASQKPRFAPILLIPMEIVRKSVQSGYIVRRGEEDAQLNVTLLEMLKQDFGLDIAGLNPLPTDASGIDVPKVLTIIRRAVMNRRGWDVLEDAYLGLFSFSKFVMWHDLKARTDDLKRNKVVASLIAGQLQWTPDHDPSIDERLDEVMSPHELCCPISADSSQLTAICTAGAGHSLILHGPPGTGKSQTITNLIAHTLAQGKTVLFVAEKMAALTVVQRRLAQLDLIPFCLELHSNKSKKKDVLEQFRAALNAGQRTRPQAWETEARRLAGLREDLNRYVNALHQPRQIGHSVFQAIARRAAVETAPDVVRFTPEAVAPVTAEQLHRWMELVRQLRVTGEGCGHPHGHAWTAAQRQDYTPQVRTQAVDALAQMSTALEGWQATVRPVAALFHVSEQEESYRDLSALLEVAKRFLAAPTISGAMVNAGDWEETREAIAGWITHGRTRDTLRSEVMTRYTDAALRLDTTAMRMQLAQTETQWLLPKWLGRRRIGKLLRATTQPGVVPAQDTLDAELERIQHLQAEEAVLTTASERARTLLGRLWQDGQADWDAVAGACQWTEELRKLATLVAGTDLPRAAALREHWAAMLTEYRGQLGPDDPVGQQIRAFTEAGTAVVNAWAVLRQLLQVAQTALVDDALAPGWFSRMQTRVARWQAHVDDLRDWCAWMRIRTQAAEAGLQPLLTPYEEGHLSHAELEPAMTRGLYQTWLESQIAADPALSSFSRGLFEDRIQQFRDLDDHFADLTRQEIFARCAAKAATVATQASRAAESSEPGILYRELQKQRAHLAVRQLFQRIPNLLPKLKPCLLMSPLSVAQYLDPAHPPFDLVIFDEASQVPTCEAVGAIARGKEVVIVGDPKQLPPTSFFMTTGSDADDDADSLFLQDLESILDDCLTLSPRMPEAHLRWHYRSRHESLIAFSNAMYYDNELLTFPSPDDLTPAVRWCPVDGIYDRGRSRQNRAEAEAVVAEIVRRLRDADLCKRTIGVVTFNQAQQRLIEDLLDEERRKDPGLEPFFSNDAVEPVFVKNLENVQGDERDVILFSICHGPDAQGRVSMNFGPLNTEGGWRRLNVAVSRARQEMLVFSTLRADQLDLSRTSARGVANLKAFLEYAERGKSALITQNTLTGRDEESLFEEQVCQALRERGHIVHTQVGCSGYRIDLAVVDPERPGRYLLGIECDGATYHRARTARDRDKLREDQLRKLGWRLHRIWSTDWWENPAREVARAEEAIAAARIAPVVPLAVASAPPPAAAETSPSIDLGDGLTVAITEDSVLAPPAPASAALPYEVCRLQRAHMATEDFYLPQSTSLLVAQITQVVNAEGPISFTLLARRVIQAWGMTQVGSRIRARLQEVCSGLFYTKTRRGDVTFYWPRDISPQDYRRFRIPGERREAEDLPTEEIANAAHEVLAAQISLPEEDLLREVARLFGYQRTGPTVQACLQQGVDLLVSRGQARREGDGRIILT
jgi:very-short-patch-repair endonuclease